MVADWAPGEVAGTITMADADGGVELGQVAAAEGEQIVEFVRSRMASPVLDPLEPAALPPDDSTAPDSTAPDSTAPDSTAPDSTADDSTAPDSTAPDSAATDLAGAGGGGGGGFEGAHASRGVRSGTGSGSSQPGSFPATSQPGGSSQRESGLASRLYPGHRPVPERIVPPGLGGPEPDLAQFSAHLRRALISASASRRSAGIGSSAVRSWLPARMRTVR
jgi:hypothetical protein